MRIAITGATGSLGGALISAISGRGDVGRVVALSRDEVKSGDLADRWADLPSIRCMLGDVRDERRLEEVFRGCDVVIHAAALKRITQSVYSPEEIIKTNVLGTVNVIRAATEVGVARVLIVSSDKAVHACNLYGMSKAVAECYAVQANSYSVPRGTRVACVRYGNVLGSRGSVLHIWREQLRRGAPLTITDPAMTRFIITLPQAAAFCLTAVEDMEGGELFVPRLPAVTVMSLAEAVWRSDSHTDDGRIGCDFCRHSPIGDCGTHALRTRDVPYYSTGLRPGGEKLHEDLLSREEPSRTWWDGTRMVVLPSHHSWREKWEVPTMQRVEKPYSSDAPDRWLSVEELVTMLQEVP